MCDIIKRSTVTQHIQRSQRNFLRILELCVKVILMYATIYVCLCVLVCKSDLYVCNYRCVFMCVCVRESECMDACVSGRKKERRNNADYSYY